MGGKWQTALRYFRTAVAVLSLAFALSLLMARFFPFSTQVTFNYRWDDRGSYIPSPLEASSFIGSNGDGGIIEVPSMRMTKDSVFFSLRLPFETVEAAEVEIAYSGDPSELLCGFRGGESSQYVFKPIHKRLLNELDWFRVTEDGVTLFQRKERHHNVSEFLSRLINQRDGDNSRIVEYFYHVPQPEPDIDPSVARRTVTFSQALRGQHTFYAYSAADTLKITFRRWDKNRNEGPDHMNVTVYKDEVPVWGTNLPDDGDTTDSSALSGPQEEKFALRHGKGIYKVTITCSDDVVLDGLEVNTPYVVFRDRLFLDAVGEGSKPLPVPTEIYTEAGSLRIAMVEPGGSLKVEVKDNPDNNILLDEPMKYKPWNLGPGHKTLLVHGSGVLINEVGSFFAFGEATYFNPSPLRTLTYTDDLLFQQIDYIIADYVIPQEEGGVRRRTLFFHFPDLAAKDGVIHGCISAPGLTSEGSSVFIQDLRIKFYRKWKSER